MRGYLILIFIFLSGFTFAQNSEFFDRADRFFMKYVKMGKVNYSELFNNREILDSLLTNIDEMDPAWNSEAFEKAFYINAYNILVIKTVLDYYPISSPKDVDGFFDKVEHQVAGNSITLDELEFEYLFAKYKDPRLHFVLNCAASSCPTLYNRAIRPVDIDDQLNFSTLMVIDRNDYVKVDHEKKVIRVSKIFDWYREMFEDQYSSVREFINFNRFTTLPDDYEIHFMQYDWSLNDQKN